MNYSYFYKEIFSLPSPCKAAALQIRDQREAIPLSAKQGE
jgi:hypothetical protein